MEEEKKSFRDDLISLEIEMHNNCTLPFLLKEE
jgi:hypothetical protein